jgi:hypothetical protein
MNLSRLAEVVLRAVLLASAFGWGQTVFALVVPPEMAFAHLERLSGREVDPTPPLSYWLKIGGAGLSFIAFLFASCTIRPDRSPFLTRSLLVFNVLCAGVLVWGAVGVGLKLWTYLPDVLFCGITGGLGLWALSARAKTAVPQS